MKNFIIEKKTNLGWKIKEIFNQLVVFLQSTMDGPIIILILIVILNAQSLFTVGTALCWLFYKTVCGKLGIFFFRLQL